MSRRNGLRFLVLLLIACAAAPVGAQPLEEVIVVTSRLRDTPLDALPASVTVLDARTTQRAGLQHFADVATLVPNLNWSAGTSRPRFFQLRGVGELEQYQGAPNPSVAFLVDDVDLSGLGGAATTFDVERIEVLRGPQGTAHGANALAGLVSVRTRAPRPEPELRGEFTAGDAGVRSAGVVAGGPFAMRDDSAWRLVAQRFEGDGFRRNAYTGRDDTNGYDETTLRARARSTSGDRTTVDLSAFWIDADNRYDAFSIDNSRTTQSDAPGRDAQRTAAASLRASFAATDRFDVRSVTAAADSDSDYSFDGDWGNDAFWAQFAPGYGDYSFESRYLRSRRTLSQDLRLVSRPDGSLDWVAGAHVLDLREENDQLDQFRDAFLGTGSRRLTSRYDARNVALYGELGGALSPRLAWTVGARGERRDAEYRDSDGERFAPTDELWGGHMALTFSESDARSWYATVSLGYKAGGFNIGAEIPASRREFRPETLWNAEAGVRLGADIDPFSARMSFFAMRRNDQQVATSLQLVPGDPLTYVFFTDNAARGSHYGVEGSAAWRLTERLELTASLGLLETAYEDFRTGDPVRDGALDGRDQAHAPRWQYAVGAEYRHPVGAFARMDVHGSDSFYFDASHDERSSPYTVVNARIGWSGERFGVDAWIRNAFDERYAMRGFYFGNEPPDFPPKRYVQLADGRHVGVTFSVRLD
jgi:outer membrane receptor protein involved in Fe transport